MWREHFKGSKQVAAHFVKLAAPAPIKPRPTTTIGIFHFSVVMEHPLFSGVDTAPKSLGYPTLIIQFGWLILDPEV